MLQQKKSKKKTKKNMKRAIKNKNSLQEQCAAICPVIPHSFEPLFPVALETLTLSMQVTIVKVCEGHA